MPLYYVNRNQQPNGDHEVHQQNCTFMPDLTNRQYLGEFAACPQAVAAARKLYIQVNGCYYCANPCHTQ